MATLNEEEIISLMREHEEAIGLFYKACAESFENKDFWHHISKEEFVHAQWLEALMGSTDKIHFDENRFNVEALKTSIDYFKNKRELIEKNEIDIVSALSLALDAEKSLLEVDYYKVYESDSAELKNIFSDLKSQTEVHVELVKTEMKKFKIFV